MARTLRYLLALGGVVVVISLMMLLPTQAYGQLPSVARFPQDSPRLSSPTPAPVQVTVKEPDKSWTIIDVVIAIGTFGVAIVALFGGEIRGRLGWRPELNASIEMDFPDATRTETYIEGQLGQVVETIPTYYYRLRVENRGRVGAQNVEVKALRLWKFNQKTIEFEVDRTFLPLNLTWSTIGGTIAPSIAPRNLFRHCDLCHIQEWEVHVGTRVRSRQSNPLEFQFNTEGRVPNRRGRGTYRVEIVLVADNAQSCACVVQIEFDGQWHAAATDMLHEGLVVSVARTDGK